MLANARLADIKATSAVPSQRKIWLQVTCWAAAAWLHDQVVYLARQQRMRLQSQYLPSLTE